MKPLKSEDQGSGEGEWMLRSYTTIGPDVENLDGKRCNGKVGWILREALETGGGKIYKTRVRTGIS